METVIVANPKAAGGKVERNWRSYERQIHGCFGLAEPRRTAKPGDATLLTRDAIGAGARRIVVVGGDGTVNEVVNGFFAPGGAFIGDGVELVLLPAGTGGDFSRSLGLSGVDWSEAMQGAEPRLIDVGRAVCADDARGTRTRHFVNISSFGASGVIVDRVNRTSKALGGKLSFLVGTVRGLMAYAAQRCRVRIDDSFEEELPVTVVAVANGRYFGGSMKIAPNAKLDDGLFDVVLISGIGTADFVRYSPKVYAGTHLDLPGVRVLRGKRVTATPLGGEVLIDLDGEQPGKLPVTYEMLAKRLLVRAPWERAV